MEEKEFNAMVDDYFKMHWNEIRGAGPLYLSAARAVIKAKYPMFDIIEHTKATSDALNREPWK